MVVDLGASDNLAKAQGPAAAMMDEDALYITHPSEGPRKLMHRLLRDVCKCPQCVDPHSKQRNHRTSDISPSIQPREIKWNGRVLEVKWINDLPGFDESHTSRYTWRELTEAHPNDLHSTSGLGRRRQLWDKAVMEKRQHWVSFNKYMNDEPKFSVAMRQLASQGLIFVKGIPDSREMVERIATRMGPLRNTFYGSTFDVRTVPNAANIAYTNGFLGFHMDLMYMNEVPGYQLLHCLQNSCDGGESLFADAFCVAEYMRSRHPEEFKVLTNLFLSYEYNHENHVYGNYRRVFETAYPGGPVVHVNYSPPFQGSLLTSQPLRRPGALDAGMAALKVFADLLQKESNIFELKLNPGECVIFENRRIVHARRQFNTATGQRWLAGAYVDEDDLRSRFAVMRRKYSADWA
ncbi:putative Gamma-butyrobetaine hydroxylase subfamily [Aspergillus candidus]|uniref:Clavaminate synthase-like protein n=1 Tax=Aspergillus candidus TaxID=41067 RepID=A0A2I2F8Y4_ASPCN|nr:Clavaminate synthase-like protein [Aspergillus candidus]PLB37081.1 Clavaminate synthase-like protein [Aspergillus candidus]